MAALKYLEGIDLEAEAAAIEADAGIPLEGLRESLKALQTGKDLIIHTPEQIAIRDARKKSDLLE